MMKTGASWDIRGIDDDIRRAARHAARRSGLSIEEWLNDAITREADDNDTMPSRRVHEDSGNVEPDAVAVTAALQRLTRRIRAMDENARAALTDLHGRLDEIVQRLGSIASLRSEPAVVAPSLRGVASIVDELSRDIDNADEKARSSVEGLRARAGGPVGESRSDSVAEAISGLDARISSMSKRIKSPLADEAPANLDVIKSRLDSLLADAPEPWAQGSAGLDETLRQLEHHVEEARSRLAASARREKPAAMAPDDDNRAPRIDEPIVEASGDFASYPSGKDMSAAVAEISARQRSIDERADLAALARGQQQISETLATLQSETAGYFSALDTSRSTNENPSDSSSLLRLDAIGEGIATLQRLIKATDGREMITRLEARVGDVTRAVDGMRNAAEIASASAADMAADRLESHLGAIAERIDQVRVQLAPKDAIEEIRERLDAVCDQIGDLQPARTAPVAPLEEVRSELAGLRQEFAEREAVGYERIKDELAELARRFDAAALPDAGSLTRVEDDLSQLRRPLGRQPRRVG